MGQAKHTQRRQPYIPRIKEGRKRTACSTRPTTTPMIEYLAIPDWDTPPRSLEDWTKQFAEMGHPAELVPEPPETTWLEFATLPVRGLALVEEGAVIAIDFEFQETESALPLIESAAKALGWELHLDDDDEEGDDE